MESQIKAYFRGQTAVASVYLFGSYASAKQTNDSDVDIGILFEASEMDNAERLKERFMVELGRLLKKDIDVVAMNRAGELILNQIFKKGRLIHTKNARFTTQFKINSLMQYSDFEFYLKRMQNSFFSSITGKANG